MGKIKHATCTPNHRKASAWAAQSPLATSKDQQPPSEDKIPPQTSPELRVS